MKVLNQKAEVSSSHSVRHGIKADRKQKLKLKISIALDAVENFLCSKIVRPEGGIRR